MSSVVVTGATVRYGCPLEPSVFGVNGTVEDTVRTLDVVGSVRRLIGPGDFDAVDNSAVAFMTSLADDVDKIVDDDDDGSVVVSVLNSVYDDVVVTVVVKAGDDADDVYVNDNVFTVVEVDFLIAVVVDKVAWDSVGLVVRGGLVVR